MAQQQAKVQSDMMLNNTVNELRNTYKMSDEEGKNSSIQSPQSQTPLKSSIT